MGSLALWQVVDLNLKRRVMQKDIFKVSTLSVVIVISEQDRGKTLQAMRQLLQPGQGRGGPS